MKRLFSLLSIFCFLHTVKTKAINITVWETDNDSSLPLDRLNNQLETLKSGNDVLKLRFEMMELQMQTLLDSVSKMDRKLNLILKFQSKNPAVPNIEDLSDEIPSKNDVNIMVQSEEREVAKSQTRIIFMTDESGKEGTQICSLNANKGLMCSDITLPTSCAASSSSKACWDDKCYIQNNLFGFKPFRVSCNNTIADGGWTVIQRRMDGSVDFQRNWTDYKHGFGDLNGEFWIGLDKLHALTNNLEPVELLVELVDFDNVAKYARYESFKIGDEESQYILSDLGSYSGDAGDSLRYHENMEFTTIDRDNDGASSNCADERGGPWWHNTCADSNLNGRYFAANTKPVPGARNGVTWYKYHSPDYSMKFVQMMIKPRN